MKELKPCPFCGADAKTPAIPIGVIDDDIPVECSNFDCEASEVTFGYGVWNARPIEDALQKRVEELENKYRELTPKWILKYQDRIDELEKEKAELQESAIVWHKYPDEKPSSGKYLVLTTNKMVDCDEHYPKYDNGSILQDRWDEYNSWDITHWAHLPEPPREEQ